MFFTNVWKTAVRVNVAEVAVIEKKLKALEEYHDIEYFSGNKCKPHYRKRRVFTKKMGRPRKHKQHDPAA